MGFLSDVVGGAIGLIGGERQNDAASDEAASARAFTKEQMKKKHQWEVTDLQKAGLNPVLSANSGAAIGSSAMASVPSNSLGDAVNTALASKRLNAEINLLEEQANKAKTETKGIEYDNARRAVHSSIWDSIGGVVRSGLNVASNTGKRIHDIGSSAGRAYSATRRYASTHGAKAAARQVFVRDASGKVHHYQ